jgi:hypothetical protein
MTGCKTEWPAQTVKNIFSTRNCQDLSVISWMSLNSDANRMSIASTNTKTQPDMPFNVGNKCRSSAWFMAAIRLFSMSKTIKFTSKKFVIECYSSAATARMKSSDLKS